jgi:GNAT superfamily N-acetyltransferase
MAFDAAYLAEVTDRLSAVDMMDWWRWYELERESIALHDDGLAALGLLNEREEGVRRFHAFVHPERVGRGLGSFLLEWAEDRCEPGGRLRAEVVAGDEAGRRLLEGRGYRRIRSGFRMLVDLDGPPAEPEWPDGFSVSTLRDSDRRVLYEVIEEAFAEEWGRRPLSFEEWERSVFAAESFDPSLCFLVRAGDEVVAAETCGHRFGMGFVGTIGVRKPWRRKGLGRALLLHGFGELYRRGERRMGLGVDAENPTGATRLYEAVGMHVAMQADTYEKAL